MCQWIQLRTRFLHGYGSIPINTIFRGMNIHLPAILMFTRGTRFWHTATYEFFCVLNPMISPMTHHGFTMGPVCHLGLHGRCLARGHRLAGQPDWSWLGKDSQNHEKIGNSRRFHRILYFLAFYGGLMWISWWFHGDFTWFQHIRLQEHATDSRICQEKDLEMVDFTYPSLLWSSWKHRFPKQIDPRQGMPEN